MRWRVCVCVCVRACGGGEGTLAGRTEHVRLEESELEAASAAEEERGVRSRAAMGRQGGMAGSIRSACHRLRGNSYSVVMGGV